MYYRFDVKKWILYQLPMALRRTVLWEFFKCIAKGFLSINEDFRNYCTVTERQLGHNANTLMLQKWLNDVFYLNGDIYITNYLNDNVYLHYQDEVPEDVYMCYQNEGESIYLDSKAPSSEYGGFVVNVPSKLATDVNLKVIKNWIEYYKAAGIVYKIVIYG